MNAYMTAPITYNVWNVLGNEWGADGGKKAIIVCALYCLKIYVAAIQKYFADCMRHMGYNICPSNPYMWIKAEFEIDRDRYYS